MNVKGDNEGLRGKMKKSADSAKGRIEIHEGKNLKVFKTGLQENKRHQS